MIKEKRETNNNTKTKAKTKTQHPRPLLNKGNKLVVDKGEMGRRMGDLNKGN